MTSSPTALPAWAATPFIRFCPTCTSSTAAIHPFACRALDPSSTAAIAADPAFFVDAAIEGVGAVRTDGGLVVQVRGTADAEEFSSAVIQFGEGENTDEWETLDTRVTAPIRNDLLGEIPAAALRSAPKWTLRVVTTHSNGATRENRYELSLQ